MAQAQAAVWWLDTDGVAEAQWPLLAALLDESEHERAARFKFDRDRRAYVAAHALGRVLLSSWHPAVAPGAWRFAVAEHGKPEVVVPAGAPRLRLNLSHTRGLVAAALAVDDPIGIDVEWLDRSPASMELARRFFAAEECAQLQGVPPERINAVFLSFWTLKEAYVKAIGKGLAQPLDSFAFTLEPPAIRFADPAADDPARWLFRRFQPTPGHALALALRTADPASVRIETAARTAAELVG